MGYYVALQKTIKHLQPALVLYLYYDHLINTRLVFYLPKKKKKKLTAFCFHDIPNRAYSKSMITNI